MKWVADEACRLQVSEDIARYLDGAVRDVGGADVARSQRGNSARRADLLGARNHALMRVLATCRVARGLQVALS